MNENVTKLLEQLANKMGTTSQYLWSVLLKQAPVSATTSVIYMLISFVLVYGLYRLHKKFCFTKDKNSESIYSEYEEGAALPMVIASVVVGIIFLCALTEVSNIVNGYSNPEYWALDKIFDTIKK